MRLLHTTRLKFGEFYDAKILSYAILSHRWTDEEVSHAEFLAGEKTNSSGHAKIIEACAVAADLYDYDWIWIDTCCINNESSAELSEAINSMFRWYHDAQVCLVYLNDVDAQFTGSDRDDHLLTQFRESEWFTRGWTLQELLAPVEVIFFSSNWQPIGTKDGFATLISEITKIDNRAITDRTSLHKWSVAARMSWASSRRTTRVEDEAYCLLGLFDVNIPLLYGEGRKAFKRLQEEIIRGAEDESIFAWDPNPTEPSHLSFGLNALANDPSAFTGCGKIVKDLYTHRQPYSITNRGIQMEVDLIFVNPETWLVPLNCCILNDQDVKVPLALRVMSGPMYEGELQRTACQYLARPAKAEKKSLVYLTTHEPDIGLPSYRPFYFSGTRLFFAKQKEVVEFLSKIDDGTAIEWTKFEPNDLHFWPRYMFPQESLFFSRAKEIFKRAIQECEKAYGYEHASTLDMICKVGQFYEFEDMLSEALEMYIRALESYRKTEGLDGPDAKKVTRKIQSLCGPERNRKKKDIYWWKVLTIAGVDD